MLIRFCEEKFSNQNMYFPSLLVCVGGFLGWLRDTHWPVLEVLGWTECAGAPSTFLQAEGACPFPSLQGGLVG